MMPPRCGGATTTNAFLSSFNPSPSSPSDTNPLSAIAISLLFLFRNFRPNPVSATRKMRGMTASPSPSSTISSPVSSGTSLSFSSPESLSEWLRPRLPSDSYSSWGIKPGTKTVHNLWLELSMGETSILVNGAEKQIESPADREEELGQALDLSLLRTVHVASVLIRNARGALLVETRQLLSDGTIRSRRRPLSEKMKPGESVEEATSRAIREELGEDVVLRIKPGSYRTRVEEKPSASYPGLPARYLLHIVDAEVVGIPQDGEFSTLESGESTYPKGAISVQEHFWKWIHEDDASSD